MNTTSLLFFSESTTHEIRTRMFHFVAICVQYTHSHCWFPHYTQKFRGIIRVFDLFRTHQFFYIQSDGVENHWHPFWDCLIKNLAFTLSNLPNEIIIWKHWVKYNLTIVIFAPDVEVKHRVFVNFAAS